MAHLATGSVGRQIESLFDGSSVAGLTDRQLLDRFTTRRDAGAEVAFTALVARHGPMVLGICRQILGDRHHAEDAFAAVFLVLACTARSIRKPDLLGTWLYGVALRTAHKAKTRLGRQRKIEEGDAMSGPVAVTVVEPMVPPADVSAMAREQAEILHREVARLPKPFRLPVVLCYFEGLTLDQAATRLRWPPGTLRSRLARARDKLRRRLTRRGLVLPSADLTLVLSPGSASARVSSFLGNATTKAAIQFTAGQALGKAMSTSVAALAQEVLRSMLINKMSAVLLTLLVLGSVAMGVGYFTHSLAKNDEPGKAVDGQRPVTTKADAPNRAAPGRMFIVGRVLDTQGKPVPNATVMAYAQRSSAGQVIGQAQSDGAGLFHLDAPRTSSAQNESVGAGALAPGYGAGWVELDPDANEPTADISLQPEQVIQGRLFDLQGRPARDVTISVDAIRRILQPETKNVRERSEGPVFGWGDVNALPGWPKPAITDADGRFIIHGIGRGRRASLTIRDPRYAQQNIRIETDGNSESKQLTLALQPAQIISGRVTYADTGKPVSHAFLGSRSDKEGVGSGSTGFQTDDEGRFRANPAPGDHFVVYAYPHKGQPYLSVLKDFDWPKGAVEHSIDLALPRGVVIRGKVTEQGSGKAIAGAHVMFNAHPRPDANLGSLSTQAETAADGSYQLTVLSSPGNLATQGPSKDYVLQVIAENLLFEGQPGGRRIYFNAFIPCDPKSGGPDLQVNVVLRRGVTVHGQVIGPDGQLVQDTWMISRVMLGPLGRTRQFWRGSEHGNTRNGRFEIHGLDPDAEVPIHFLEPKRKLGATAYFSGTSASGGPVTVRLEPCVTARARLIDPDGKPIGGFSKPWLISMVVTPGPFNSIKARKEGLLLADEARLPAVDPINYEHDPVSDVQGRITFAALIPGATYRIIDRTPFRGPDGPQHRKDFTVKPGETLDLGDIVIEKSQP